MFPLLVLFFCLGAVLENTYQSGINYIMLSDIIALES